jgi:polysaccharide deacetylase family protein (PEP-CTERM system associated)
MSAPIPELRTLAPATATAYAPRDGQILNAMTIDVEDYFQVSAFEKQVSRAEWGTFESRVCPNTERLLDLFAEFHVHATFFVLGWVAERFPGLIRRIVREGHELASHGYHHRLVYATSPEAFRADIRRARDLLETASGGPVVGYRAPSYSIIGRSMWALDVLIEEGYRYDASIYPINHDRYGIRTWPRQITRVERRGGRIWEVPGSTIRRCGVNLPIGGGGYFRLLPFGWTRSGIAHLNRDERQPAVFYLHPWEIDPDQPRIAAPLLTRLRHYRNLAVTEGRLRALLGHFSFGRIQDCLGLLEQRQTLASVASATVLSAAVAKSRVSLTEVR